MTPTLAAMFAGSTAGFSAERCAGGARDVWQSRAADRDRQCGRWIVIGVLHFSSQFIRA
jgi:hypothetical protein